MNNQRRDENSRGSQVNGASAEVPETTAVAGQDDVAGYFDITRLGPPVCLPVLPTRPEPRHVIEPLGVPRGREFLP